MSHIVSCFIYFQKGNKNVLTHEILKNEVHALEDLFFSAWQLTQRTIIEGVGLVRCFVRNIVKLWKADDIN